jgi:hypothetical protein
MPHAQCFLAAQLVLEAQQMADQARLLAAEGGKEQ